MTMGTLGYARLILLVKEVIEVKILEEFMEKDISGIWVKLGQSGRKPLLVGSIYREQHLLLPGAPRATKNTTGDMRKQQDRWWRAVRGWKEAARGGKCCLFSML